MREKTKTCVDCLNCKQSKLRNKYWVLAFCVISKKKTLHQVSYWSGRKPCAKFVDMEGDDVLDNS